AALVEKIGSKDGQLLAPVRGLVEQASTTLQLRLKDVRELLDGELDPSRSTSTLGRALKQRDELVDPEQSDSVQAVRVAAVHDVVDEGGALGKAVAESVGDAIKPLADQIDRLALQMAGAAAADRALQGTTMKGTPYEEEIVAELQGFLARLG